MIPDGTLIRRATGGGIVAHADDWTYTLVIPLTHPMASSSAKGSYRFVHNELVDALNEMGTTAELQPCHTDYSERNDQTPIATTCFTQAETYDVIRSDGEKLAGAAQKRNRHGLLIQGSIETQKLEHIDWDAFEQKFAQKLATALDLKISNSAFPEFPDAKIKKYSEKFASVEWNERR